MIKQYTEKDEYDAVAGGNNIKHYLNWSKISDHKDWILIIGGLELGNTNALLNPINLQPNIDKICFYAKDPFGSKYQYLRNKREQVGLTHCNDSKALIEFSANMGDIYADMVKTKSS